MYPYDYLEQNDYLIHHGILGQKWGVRRYQNEDGSLTPAGKQRIKSEDQQNYENLKKRNITELSNKELEELNKRSNLISNYRKNNPKAYKKALNFCAAAAGAMGTLILLRNNSGTIIKDGKNFAKFAVKVLGKVKNL